MDEPLLHPTKMEPRVTLLRPPTVERYDVALSFLSRDVALARELHTALSVNLKCFFYERNQEEIAGTEGMESFRRVFREKSSLNVILFREQWGNTPWTGVEEAAIRDSALSCHYTSFLLVMLKSGERKPSWIPESIISYNHQDFGSEQLAGAIRLRAIGRGVTPHVQSAAQLAFGLEAARLDTARRKRFEESDAGVVSLQASVNALFAFLENAAKELKDSAPAMPVEFDADFESERCLRLGRMMLVVHWTFRYTNSIQDADLVVTLYDGPAPKQGAYRMKPSKVVGTARYAPHFAPADAWVWRDGSRALSGIDLMEQWLQTIVKKAYEPFRASKASRMSPAARAIDALDSG